MSMDSESREKRYAWIVLVANFVGLSFSGAISYSYGLFYPYVLTTFGASEMVVLSVTSTQCACLYGIGLLAGSLTDTFGCRAVIIGGSLLTSLSIAVASMATNIVVFYIAYGFMTGMGVGTHVTATIVSIHIYFKKSVAAAMGIAVSGVGFGTFIFAPLVTALTDYYGWRGCMLLLGGVYSHGAVLGALVRPLRQTNSARRQSCKCKTTGSGVNAVDDGVDKGKIAELCILNSNSEKCANAVGDDASSVFLNYSDIQNENIKVGTDSSISTYTNHQQIPTVDVYTSEALTTSKRESQCPLSRTSEPSSEVAIISNSGSKSNDLKNNCYDSANKHVDNHSSTYISTTHQQQPTPVLESSTIKSCEQKNCKNCNDDVSGADDTTMCAKLVRSVTNMFDVRLFANVYVLMFLLVSMNMTIMALALFTFTPAKAHDHGFSPYQVSMVLSMAGAGDIAGRLFAGLLAARADHTLVYMASDLIAAVFLLVTTFVDSFVYVTAATFLAGVGTGGYMTMACTALAQYVGAQHFARVYGFMHVGTMLGSALFAPLGAYIHGLSHSYDTVFRVNAVFPLTAALLLLVTYILRRIRKPQLDADVISVDYDVTSEK